MFARLTFIAALLLAPAVAAQDSSQSLTRPDFPIRSMNDMARDAREADGMIAASGHPGLFKNVTEHRGPAILHLNSGMVCRFVAGHPDNRVTVYRVEESIEDVSCGTVVDGVILTHYAYRYPQPQEAEREIHGAIAAIRDRNPDLSAYEGETANLSVEGFERPPTYVARAVIVVNGTRAMTKAMVAEVGDWMVKQRMTVRLEDALNGDLWSEVTMLRVLAEVDSARSPAGD